MNPEQIQAWALATSATIAALKEAITLIPTGEKRNKAEALLNEAEAQRRLAELEIAIQQKFQICRRHFPAGIMIQQDDGKWLCRECNKGQANGLPDYIPMHLR